MWFPDKQESHEFFFFFFHEGQLKNGYFTIIGNVRSSGKQNEHP